MTIVTKQQAGEKRDEEKKLPEAVLETQYDLPTPTPSVQGRASSYIIPSPFDFYLLNRRRRLLSSLCIGLLVLWLILATLVASLLLFRYFSRRHVVYGWCGTEMLNADDHQYERLRQQVEVDPVNLYEKVTVPQFGRHRPAVFVHDFKQNLTAIVDLLGRQCFIKPLDRKILPPRNFTDLLTKMENGYYEQNTRVIAEQWIAQNPPLTRLQARSLKSWMIYDQCDQYRMFMLHQVHSRRPLYTSGRALGRGGLHGDKKARRRKRRSPSRVGCAGSESAEAAVRYLEFEPKNSVHEYSIQVC